jgi:hypothetical protein
MFVALEFQLPHEGLMPRPELAGSLVIHRICPYLSSVATEPETLFCSAINPIRQRRD